MNNHRPAPSASAAISGLLAATAIFVAAILVVAWIGLLFKMPIAWMPTSVGILAVVAVFVNMQCAGRASGLLLRLLGLGALVALSLAFAFATNDVSYDGWAYHQPAIVALLEGWNPVYVHDVGVWWRQVGDSKPWLSFDDARQLYSTITYYPKGAWILAAAFAAPWGNIEAGKTLNLLLLLATLGSASRFFSELLASRFQVWVLSLLAATNHIVVAQLTSFMVDGTVACTFTIAMTALGAYLIRQQMLDLVVAASAILILSTTKATGLVYGFCLIAIFAVFVFRRKYDYRRLIAVGMGVLVLLAVVGYSPYVQNQIEKGSPFYPLNVRNVIAHQANPDFLAQNRLVKLAISNFADPAQNFMLYPKVGLPRLSRDVLWHYSISMDSRFSGFGPYFGWILVASLLCGFVLLKRTRRGERDKAVYFAICTIVATTLINPEAWWARFAPQLWLLPLIMFPLLQERAKIPARILLALFAANAVLVNGLKMSQWPQEREQMKAISTLSALQHGHASVAFRVADGAPIFFVPAFQFHMHQLGIEPREVGADVECNLNLLGRILVCAPKE